MARRCGSAAVDGIQTVYCLGDLVGKGPDGVGVVDLCDEVCNGVVRGNWDSAMVDTSLDEPWVNWHRDQLDQDRLAYLGGLANTIDLQVSGRWIRLFHASAKSETHRVFLQSPQTELDAMFTNTDFTGHDHPAPDVVGYGDLHQVFLTPAGGLGRTLMNVGSVGNPWMRQRPRTLCCTAGWEAPGRMDSASSSAGSATTSRPRSRWRAIPGCRT